MSGVVSTVAGGTSTGNADGYGTAAAFNRVAGISVDCCGRIYISDYNNMLIRRILPNGNCPMSLTISFTCYLQDKSEYLLAVALAALLMASGLMLGFTIPPSWQWIQRECCSSLIATTTESARYHQMVMKMPMFIFSANLICADPCPSSSIYSGGSCSTVPAGYYLPADMFFGNYYACPAGSYSLSGSSACTPCGPAAYSSVAASACVSCPPGTYFSGGSCAMVPTG